MWRRLDEEEAEKFFKQYFEKKMKGDDTSKSRTKKSFK